MQRPVQRRYPSRDRPLPDRSVIQIGHFPPPVHGMAVTMEALGNLFATLGPLIRIRTVPARPASSRLYHLKRAYLVSRAGARLLMLRTKSDAVIFSVDAGKGMLYVIALTWLSRRLGYRVVLQHHSSAYLSHRSWLAATLVYVGGSGTRHLYSCQSACDEFRRLYPRARRTSALSVAYAVELPPERQSMRALVSRPLTVGHLSNLTLDKGLDDVIEFGRAAIPENKVDKVILAGPLMEELSESSSQRPCGSLVSSIGVS